MATRVITSTTTTVTTDTDGDTWNLPAGETIAVNVANGVGFRISNDDIRLNVLDSAFGDARIEATVAVNGNQDDIRIINRGVIAGTPDPLGGFGTGISISGERMNVTNFDTISAVTQGVVMNGTGILRNATGASIDANATGVRLAERTALRNDGIIVARSDLNGPGEGVVNNGTGAIINNGRIVADGVGVEMNATVGISTLRNTGEITSTIAPNAVVADGNAVIVNLGEINGDIRVGFNAVGGDSTVNTSRGTLNGDIVTSSARDRIFGSQQDDTIESGSGGDFVVGNDGDDTIALGGGDDRGFGGMGNDTIEGGSGNDQIRGEAGNDILMDGPGADRLFGGTGVDQFIFTADSRAAGFEEVIVDFEDGTEVIDLAAVIGGTLAFIGSDPFTGSFFAPMPAVRVENQGPNTLVQIDADGFGLAAGSHDIRVLGVTNMDAADFIL